MYVSPSALVSHACTSIPTRLASLAAVLRNPSGALVERDVHVNMRTTGQACYLQGLSSENPTDAEEEAAFMACVPAVAADTCTVADISAMMNDDEPSDACMLCTYLGVHDVETVTEEDNVAAMLACAPPASAGDCTAMDFAAVNANGNPSTACTSLLPTPPWRATPPRFLACG